MAPARSFAPRLTAALALALLAASPSDAASIGIDPAVKVVSCTAADCDLVTIQVTLQLGENGADSFGFDIFLDDAALIGLSPGPLAGNPIPGMNGTLDLLPDGTTLRGQLDSLPGDFDGPQTFDVAIIPVSANGSGTAELRFISAEIACTLCNGGAGQIFPEDNLAGELIGVIHVVPEPAPLALVALGLGVLCVASRRADARGRRQGGVR